jgi:hypothetical protein
MHSSADEKQSNDNHVKQSSFLGLSFFREPNSVFGVFFFFRNGVFPASASIDAHGRFIKARSKGFSLQMTTVSPA